jgi:DNA polymerase I
MGVVLDFHIIDVSSEDNTILLYGVTKEGKRIIVRDEFFPAYFFASFQEDADLDSLIYQINGLMVKKYKVIKTKVVDKRLLGDKKKFLKILVNDSKAVKHIARIVKKLEGINKTYERGVKHVKKYLFDKKLKPLTSVRVKGVELTKPPSVDYYINAESVESSDNEIFDYKILSFDIETYNPNGISEFDRDPIIMISYATNKGDKGVITWKENNKKCAKVVKNEKELLELFEKIVHELKPSFIVTYNGDNFDFAYLSK